MPAVLFGSIGTVAETSELQRKSFNDAFAAHDLDWNWSRDEYRQMLRESGGQSRIAAYASERGEDVDAAAVYETKSALFRRGLSEDSPPPRDGVAETIAAAREAGFKVALVTTTSRQNLDALGEALGGRVDISELDLVVDRSAVEAPKPDAAVYEYALAQLGEAPGDCVAIENNVDGVAAAKAAGLTCVAYPGPDNADHDFAAADRRLEELSFSALEPLAVS